ncbi:MAG: cell division protein FtsQ/DivIB [Rhodobacteraceae bacterium]|nr:cell division protein FtsQ/DivIB [Paracoccaceae bacterium]
MSALNPPTGASRLKPPSIVYRPPGYDAARLNQQSLDAAELANEPAPKPTARKAKAKTGRDPAPSRLRYRYQRLMLTPLFRKALRYGLPAGLVLLLGGLWWGEDSNRAMITDKYQNMRSAIRARPEFRVQQLDVSGADTVLTGAVASLLNIDFPISSFDLDLAQMRASITELTAVRDAVLRVRPGGTLDIRIVQRAPVAVWRHTDGLRLIDEEGVMTGMITSRAARPDLPLIAGDGARAATDEAMALFAAAAPIAPHVRGLVRMGERRWDMILEGGQRILLPAIGAEAALNRVLALDAAQGMFKLDITVIDMRNAARPIVRLSPYSSDAVQGAVVHQ